MSERNHDLPPPAQLMQLLAGMVSTQMIAVASELGIADRLQDGPKTSDDIARSAGASPDGTYRLMRGLSTLGVLEEHEGRRFGLTSVGACLCDDHPVSLGSFAKYIGSSWHWAIWSDLLHSVKTGGDAFTKVHGSSIFDWMGKHPEALKLFSDAMTSLSKTMAYALVYAYDFSTSRRVADIGGGQGFLLAEILKANPHLSGALFDVPSAAESAKEIIASYDLTSRCEPLAGDFFRAAPEGYDTYLLKHIIHDWSDERAVAILKNIVRAMEPEGRVLVIEQVMLPVGVPDLTKVLDLEMLLVMDGGRERTAEEYGALFRQVGLRMTRVIPTMSPLSIVEARIEAA